jgi:signal transduction histidine kinase
VTKLMDADPAGAREAAVRAKEIASDGLAEVRRSVAALRPSPLDDYPLPEAIRRLADDTRRAGLVVSFEQTGWRRTLPSESETVLYRAAQESLTNIFKHAHASAAEMVLAYEPEGIRLRVRDDGIGRLPQDAQDDVGLTGLRYRVGALNGSVRAENHPDGGFLVEVRLPY